MSDCNQQWMALRSDNRFSADRLMENLRQLSQGRGTWAELLQIRDAELLDMARMGAAKLEMGQLAAAERAFWALTELDPGVPFFWAALGDSRARLNKLTEAIDAYGQCIREASRVHPPALEEIRSACLRRGKLLVRTQQAKAALEDFRTVLELDTPDSSDGEHARFAIEALVADGRLNEEALAGLPATP
jgi:tetratricopeptide (TPR) repeat protein